MDTSRDGQDQGAIETDAKKEAWSAGESKGREMALRGETESENVKSAGREAGRSAAERAGADADVGETPGEHGALAGWCDQNPDLARAETARDLGALRDRIDTRQTESGALRDALDRNAQSLGLSEADGEGDD